MKKYAKLLPLLLIVFPMMVLAIGGTKRIIDLPGFTADRLLFVDSSNELQDSGITIGGSDDTLSGIASLNGITSTTLGYIDFTSSGQTQLDAKLDDFTGSTDNVLLRTDGTGGDAIQESGVTVSDADAISGLTQVDISAAGELRFQDTSGGQYMGFKAPSTVTSSETFTLPDGDGTNGQVLKTNGSGVLSWQDDGGGSSILIVQAKTADFTAEGGSSYIVDTSSGDVTASIESVASGSSGEEIEFKVIDGTNDLILDPNGSETIDNLTTRTFSGEDETVSIRQDGSEWWIIKAAYTDYHSVSPTTGDITATGSTYVDLTGSSITLVPGTWELYYSINVFMNWVSGSTGTTCGLRITDSSNSLVTGSESGFYNVQTSGNDDAAMDLSKSTVLTVTTETTYKLRIVSNQSSAAATCQNNSASSFFDALFYARRI